MENLILIIDTREQTPLTFGNLPSERAALRTADYSVKGYESVFGIERKTIGDLIGSLTQGRERFMREMQRLQAYTFKRLLIIGSRAQIERGEYRSNATPKAILASVATIEARYDIPAVYASNEKEAARMIEGWAWYWAREQAKQGQTGTNTQADAGANLDDSGGTLSDATNQLATVAGWKDAKAADQLVTVTSWKESTERQGTEGKPRSLPPPRKPSIQHEKDKLGNIIPPNLLETWGGRDSVKEASSAVRGVRLAIKKAQDKHDQTWAGLNFLNTLMHLDNVLAQVEGAIPHCVCLYCQGIGCRACRGVGIMTKFQYSNAPRDMKEHETHPLPPPRPRKRQTVAS